MKQLLLALAIVSPLTASADIIKCTFTEPFVSSTYSMTQSTLTYESIDGAKKLFKKYHFKLKVLANLNWLLKMVQCYKV